MSLVQEKHSSIIVSNNTINTINKFKKDLQSSLNDYNKENIHKKVNETLEKLNKKNENKRSILDLDSITAIADEIKSNLKKKKSKSKQKPNKNNVSSLSKPRINNRITHSSLPKSYSNAILNKKMSSKSLSTNIISPNKSVTNKEDNINLSITKIENSEENKYDHYIKENIYQVKKKQKIYHYKYRRVIKERSLLKEKPYISSISKRIFDVKTNEINQTSSLNHVYKSTKSGIFFNKSPLYKRVSSVIKYRTKEKDNLIALYKMKEMKGENDFYKQSTKRNVSKSDFSTWRNENLRWEEKRKMKINHMKEVKEGLIDSKIYKYTGYSNSNQIDETNHDKIFTNQYSKLINNSIYPNKEKFLNRLDLYENKKNNNKSLILSQSLPSFCPITINNKSTSIISSKVNKERILNTTNFFEDEDRREEEKIYTKQKIKGKKYKQDNMVNQNKSKVNNKLQERMTIDEEKNSLCNSNYDINIRENTFWENKENILFANNRYKEIFEFI